MSFRYNVLNLNSLAKMPTECMCEDRLKWESLNHAVIDVWKMQSDKKLMVDGIEYELIKSGYQPNEPDI